MAEVTIYTRAFCGFCTAAKRLLDEKGVSYEEHDATMKPAVRSEMIQRSGGGSTFPQIFVGDRHVGGCTELYEADRAGEFDRMLAEVRAR